MGASAGEGVGNVLDPVALANIPPTIAGAVRAGLSEAITTVFIAALPVALIVLIATALIANNPLRDAHEN
ncbi:hypothetical protein [Bowdeniella nasicola]|nr:hypothetical protein [Bowdeniella nasicola]